MEDIILHCSCGGHVVGDELVEECSVCGCPLVLAEYRRRLEWRVDESEPSMWRYRAMLPSVERMVSLGEGLTPVRRVGGVYVKLENRNPTGSYADRASSLIASRVYGRLVGRTVRLKYVEGFTVSLAYYLSGTARVVVEADPSTIDPHDVVELAKAGASLVFTQTGSGVYIGYRTPLTVEALKTIAYEIAEAGIDAENIYVPAETGLLAVSLAKGFRELEEMGVATGYRVVAVAVEDNEPPLLAHTPYPVRLERVSSRETVEALVELASKGLRVKPLSAAAYAVAKRSGEGLAIITSSISWKPVGARARGRLAEKIMAVLEDVGEATAYTVWRMLGDRYSLRGVYKALAALEATGRICSRYVMRGRRRVKLFKKCG